ncbi:MAG: flagellar biosynthesis protein FlhB [Planctomycetota bacterium]
MAEEFAGEKTEPATPRKREEAREKGQVARSQDLSTAVVLLAAFCVVFAISERLLQGMSDILTRSFTHLGGRLTFDSVLTYGVAGLSELVRLVAPMFVILFVLALAVNLLQVGWRISPQVLSLDLTKLSPIKGFKRIFSIRGLVRLAFGLLKLVIVGSVLYVAYLQIFDPDSDRNLLVLLYVDLPQALSLANVALFRTGGMACVALLILAILDFSFQRWKHEQDLRMTKQEVREEHKRMEGDPKLKDRRRRIAQQLALQRMMQDVPEADVVITNPTHFSCAIQYKENDMRAPRLVAKGQDHTALRIRAIARENDIPIVEEPPLARTIFATTEVGDEVPPELYAEVARVLAYVYRLGQERSRESVGSES